MVRQAKTSGFCHVNRRGQTYYLQSRKKGGGKTGYSFAQKVTGELVKRLPAGFEAHESPEDGRVFLRKIQKTAILPLEREQVCAAVRKLAGTENFIVAADGRSLVVYLPSLEPDGKAALLAAMFPLSKAMQETLKAEMVRDTRYVKMMRFVLMDAKQRLFWAERWCFLGSIDNWYVLKGGLGLAELLEEYVPHLGKESFFELM